jgi:hypothetical protein
VAYPKWLGERWATAALPAGAANITFFLCYWLPCGNPAPPLHSSLQVVPLQLIKDSCSQVLLDARAQNAAEPDPSSGIHAPGYIFTCIRVMSRLEMDEGFSSAEDQSSSRAEAKARSRHKHP